MLIQISRYMCSFGLSIYPHTTTTGQAIVLRPTYLPACTTIHTIGNIICTATAAAVIHQKLSFRQHYMPHATDRHPQAKSDRERGEERK